VFCFSYQFQMFRTVKGSTSGVQPPGKALIVPLRHSIRIDLVSTESHIRWAPKALLRCSVSKCTSPAFPIVWCLSTGASLIPASCVTSRDWLPQYSRAAPRSLLSVHLYLEQTKRLFHLSCSIFSYLLLWNLVDWYRLPVIVVCNRPQWIDVDCCIIGYHQLLTPALLIPSHITSLSVDDVLEIKFLCL
jgi:hypothetical protein